MAELPAEDAVEADGRVSRPLPLYVGVLVFKLERVVGGTRGSEAEAAWLLLLVYDKRDGLCRCSLATSPKVCVGGALE